MKKRVISAIVALIIIVPLIILGGWPFYIGATLIGLVGFRELLRLREGKKDIPIITKVIALASFLILVLTGIDASSISLVIDFKMIALILFLNLLPIVIYRDNKKYNIEDALFSIGAIFFLGFAFNFLIVVRNFDLNYLIFLLLLTIFTDIFAYVGGSLVGKHKMIPSISPKKTWEGCVFGTLMGVFVSTFFYVSVFNYDNSMFLLIAIVTGLSIIGQIGDLIFSSIKRHYGVKDFSSLMPGHGGILDRLDSILFVLLAFSFIIVYL